MKYKIGIIGCGKITAVRHAPEYAANPKCEIAAFYDVDAERARKMAAAYGGRVCTSVDELLSLDLDAVSICAANKYHAELSVRALLSGKHVLCEKPMAVTAEECERMLEAERSSGKMLLIGQNQRLNASHQKAREMLLNGEIGKLLSFRLVFGHPGPEEWVGSANSWFFDRKVAGFGAMADLGVHKTDLLQYLTGLKIVKTSTVLGTIDKKYPDGSPIAVDDNAFCIYTLSNGATGTMHVSWTFYGDEDNSTVLYGTKGRIRIFNDPEYSLILERADGTKKCMNLDSIVSNKEQTEGVHNSSGVIDAFIRSLETGIPYLAAAEEGASAMHVIFANEESAESGKEVEIPYNMVDFL